MSFDPIILTPPFSNSFKSGSLDTVTTLDPHTGNIIINNWRLSYLPWPFATGTVSAGFSTMVTLPFDSSTRLTFGATFSGIGNVIAAAYLGYADAELKLFVSAKPTRSGELGGEANTFIYGYYTPVFWGGGEGGQTTVSVTAQASRPRSRVGADIWQVSAWVYSTATCSGAASQATASIDEGGIASMFVSGT